MSNKRIDFSKSGGFPLHQGVLEFMQTGYNEALKGLATMAGNMIIVSGMMEAGNNVSAGWIVINGELIPFLAGAKQANFIVEEISGPARFQDGADKTVYFTKQARFGSGVTQYPYTNLKRIGSNSIMDDADTFATSRALRSLSELSLYEPNVIVSGCDVSNINLVAQTCTISAGKVLIGNQYFATPVYNGAFPVWINASGVFVTAAPVGMSIQFNPHTSQRKADVLRRGLHAPGEILMSRVISDRFDPVTGIGKWEWLGFRLNADLRGRVPVGLWFGDDGSADVYDPNFRGMGNGGGENKHTLSVDELPALQFRYMVPVPKPGGVGIDGSGFHWEEEERVTNILGAGLSHNNQQPYSVIAFIERI